MRLTTTVFVVASMGIAAWAQMASPAQTINNVRNQVRSATNAVNQRTEQAASPKPEPPPSQVSPRRKAVPAKAGASQMEVKKKGKPVVTKTEEGNNDDGALLMRGKRDPFVSVIRAQSPAGPGCATGKKCLVIGDLALKGIVRSQTGMIAVVENAQRKTYFLHENDPVFNGQVTRIEPDAIVFTETVVDRIGRQSTREIVKRILKPSIS